MADPRLPRIRCAVCDKPVDHIVWSEDRANDTQVLAVSCHGERETMSLSDLDIDQLGPDGYRQIMEQEGIAFATRRLAANGGGNG